MRVLGVSVPNGTGTFPDGAGFIAMWQDATGTVDGRLAALARELHSYDDVDFNKLADKGIHGLLDAAEAKALDAALAGYQKAAGPQTADGLRAAVSVYQSLLDASPLVEALDDNPFGIDVEIYATLSDALRRIDGALPKHS